MREFDLLAYIYRASSEAGSNAAGEGGSDRILIPPGDDMAMLRLHGSRVLAAVDQLVAGRHVLLESTPIALVGRKAITRSLSDIAAMAAKPVATLAAVVLPPGFGEKRAIELFDAMRETAAEYDCPLAGGDIAFHAEAEHPLVCSVTVLAEPDEGREPIRRGGAKVGDVVYVTGELGGAIESDGGGHHLTFQPRIEEARELARLLGDRLRAMIDISDGLGRDCSHIAAPSGVRILLHPERIPCRADCTWQDALGEGEDYELCFTAVGDVPPRLGGSLAVTAVGEVLARDEAAPLVGVLDGGLVVDVAERGWQHQ